MSDLDDKLARWRDQTKGVTPPAELLAQLTALAVAQTAATGAAGAASGAAKAVATKGVALKVSLAVFVACIVGGGVLAARSFVPDEAPAVVSVDGGVGAVPETPKAVRPLTPRGPGFLTVRTNKPAVVILDGVNLGPAPLLRQTVRAGKHQLLINCLRDGGTYSAGVKRIDVAPSGEVEVTNTCIERVVLGDGGVLEDRKE